MYNLSITYREIVPGPTPEEIPPHTPAQYYITIQYDSGTVGPTPEDYSSHIIIATVYLLSYNIVQRQCCLDQQLNGYLHTIIL